KQVTGHPRPEHCTRGWSFLSLLTGFFPPSTRLMPYLTKFLQDSGPSQELARSSQEHLQRTVKYGGRRRMPPPGEMKAFLKGQAIRLLLIHLPGGVDYRTNIQTFTVAAEVQEELCWQMGITEPQEVQEFALFLIKEKSKLGDRASRWGHSPAQGPAGAAPAARRIPQQCGSGPGREPAQPAAPLGDPTAL
ncbi:MYO15B isoform 36, partial [Pongo abelii]